MRDTTAGAAIRVRRREEGDLGACVRVLAAVRDRDGHSVDWAAVPAEGLWGRCRARAVESFEGVDAGRTAVVGRLFVAPGCRGALWTLPATVEQEWCPDRRVAVRACAAPRPGG
ncbi:hypothetical protein OH779_32425 [Actinacidiphila glaucinigra]|uniref:hypothetical protein n=1 Tax=Actinacidiphila glaucinigra TaxID=235986 RepID=UPI0038694FF9